MAFLREGAIKDLLMRGPNKDELLQWASENVLYSRSKTYDKISQYASQFGLSVSELESLANIFAANENNPSNLDILSDLLSNIKGGKEEDPINEDLEFDRSTNPYDKLRIGKRSGEDYLWKKFPYEKAKNVIYLKTPPIDLDEKREYRAVMYQGGDWDKTGEKWSLSIEIYADPGRVNMPPGMTEGGWDRTPGGWYLETLLHEDSYSSGPINDTLMIDGGQRWGVKNMKSVLDEARKIRDEYINKTNDMKESILMPRFLKEDHHKECSDEVSMAKIQLKSIMNDAAEILQGLDNCEQLDAWVQSKISVAEDYITTVAKYMKYEEEEKPEQLPLIPAGGETQEPEDDMLMPPMEPIDAMGPDEEPEGDMMQSDIAPDEEGEEDMDFDMEMDFDMDLADDGEDDLEDSEPDEEDLEIFAKGDLADLK
jgi:hypothetical protein